MGADAPRMDVNLVNARVLDGTMNGREFGAVGVRDGRVAAIGTAEEVRAAVPGVPELDCEGRRVMPGLFDSHVHGTRAGLTWDHEVRWGAFTRLQQGLDAMVARAQELGPGQPVVTIGGWQETQLVERRLPTSAELDAALPNNPAFVQAGYDQAVLNTAAAQLCADAGIGSMVASLAEGRDHRLGAIKEFGPSLKVLLGGRSHEDQVASTVRFLEHLASVGITTFLDPGGRRMDASSYRAMFDAWQQRSMSARARLYVHPADQGSELEEIRAWIDRSAPGFGDDYLRLCGVGEAVAWGCHDGLGVDHVDIDADQLALLREISIYLAKAGWPMKLHAVLDTTISNILDVWEEIDRTVRPVRGLTWSMCHVETISDRNLDRAAALGIGLAVQNRIMGNHAVYARSWGEERFRTAPPIADILERGIPTAAGTDGTTANNHHPWRALWWFISGKGTDGGPERDPAHRLSRLQAINMYTERGTWFTHDQDRLGTLAVGKLADLLVLNDDVLEVPEDRIPELYPELTLLGGRPVHATGAFSHLG